MRAADRFAYAPGSSRMTKEERQRKRKNARRRSKLKPWRKRSRVMDRLGYAGTP